MEVHGDMSENRIDFPFGFCAFFGNADCTLESITFKVNLNNIKYIPKLLSALAFLLLLILFAILFLGRHDESLRVPQLLNLFPDFYTHASNLCISYFLVSSTGYVWLMLGARMIHIGYLASVLVVANIICEFWVSWGNVPDVMDACYGFIGVAVAVGFLWVVRRFGLRIR